jgi:hypothetical protein
VMDSQGRVTPEETRIAMQQLYREDREANLQKALLHALRDDLKPLNAKGRWKANSLLVLGAFLFLAIVAVFLYFSRGGAV